MSNSTDGPRSAAVPLPLRAALLAVVVEAAALVGLAGAFLLDVLRGLVLNVGTTVAMAVFFLGLALVLVAAGRALWRGRRWGRGPVITWQLLQAVTAIAMTGVLPAYMVVLLVLTSAGVIAGVLWPSSREYASVTGSPSVIA
ncbi:hypothetical protein FE374_12855 [Georgenia yuyongxinii]|uniref:Integral membrane protein n=1 Tax=Georgenia yuyongxinii TaxID=2589797 RepID=A0A5B8C7Q4_9MICO|nr:hypothetical protein [Georgenia yuyongxinii]QDC25385.1 hypothetical protein FE374_12855 [Georgenia yuyongxinii]